MVKGNENMFKRHIKERSMLSYTHHYTDVNTRNQRSGFTEPIQRTYQTKIPR